MPPSVPYTHAERGLKATNIMAQQTPLIQRLLLADCTPYLLQLGLSKSHMSMVWIAGPLSGLIVQPIVGAIADNSKSRWGRRRPFMIGGSVVVVLCLLTLGYTAEVVGVFVERPDAVGLVFLLRSKKWGGEFWG